MMSSVAWLQTLWATLFTHLVIHRDWLQSGKTVWDWCLWVIQDYMPIKWQRKTFILRGKITDLIDGYNVKPSSLCMFSDRFHAIWNYILQDLRCCDQHDYFQNGKGKGNHDIREISENFMASTSPQGTAIEMAFLFVSQRSTFILDKALDLYAQTSIRYDEESSQSRNGGVSTSRHMHIELRIHSYTRSVVEIQQFLDSITENYLANIRKSREKMRFLYTLFKPEYDTLPRDCWMEHRFLSNRTFSNLFFEGKPALMAQLDFFVNNQAWYDRMGIPYTLGLGLSGPPGTGKTSLIKCIANYLDRHIVSMSLKMIKTRVQLLQFFYESQYNGQNRSNSIGFDKKIMVLEDLDCLGEMVKNRSSAACDETQVTEEKLLNKTRLSELLQNDLSKKQVDHILAKYSSVDEAEGGAITLDDILNLWDGLCETPHRILIITSNHYDQLDPALVRPGRIDLTLKMGTVTASVLKDMFAHLFEKPWPLNIPVPTAIQMTPAQVINVYLHSGRDEMRFLEMLVPPTPTKKKRGAGRTCSLQGI